MPNAFYTITSACGDSRAYSRFSTSGVDEATMDANALAIRGALDAIIAGGCVSKDIAFSQSLDYDPSAIPADDANIANVVVTLLIEYGTPAVGVPYTQKIQIPFYKRGDDDSFDWKAWSTAHLSKFVSASGDTPTALISHNVKSMRKTRQ